MDQEHAIEIILNRFDNSSRLYPLRIVPGFLSCKNIAMPNNTYVYSGIHFIDTTVLLSIAVECPPDEPIGYEPVYWELKDPDSDAIICFESIEVYNWCQGILDSNPLCWQILYSTILYQNNDFQEFEQAAKELATRSLVTEYYNWRNLAEYHTPKSLSESEEIGDLADVLTAMELSRTGNFVFDIQVLAKSKDLAELCGECARVLAKASTATSFSRREMALVKFATERIAELLPEAQDCSVLPEKAKLKDILRLNNVLLRLRRALL